MTLSEELTWRGFVNQSTFTDITAIDAQPIKFYWGVDPSADSLTIGNLAAAMMVKCFIKHGHQAFLLVGGATGLIGDPDGKKEERSLSTHQQIADNAAAITAQYKLIFQGQNFDVVNNYDWFKNISYLDFLRDIGKHVPMRQMLARDFVETRLGEGSSGISYAEFSYVLIQAYDFLQLNEKHGVTLQVCGSDQWGNSIAGVDLLRRKNGIQANVFSAPLIINKATGQKFGKSEDGAIWLDPAKTSPTAFYQFWVNCDDDAVDNYLKIFTELDPAEINQIIAEHNQKKGQRLAQNKLGYEVTKLIHGKRLAEQAQAVTDIISGKQPLEQTDDLVDILKQELKYAKTTEDGSIIEALVLSGLASSNTEARRFISENAVSINNQKVSRASFDTNDFRNGRLLLRRGRAYKDTALIELG
ncbi:MAG: tyrosine--tRNA ligase [Candidatus Saccharimonadales bacterium]